MLTFIVENDRKKLMLEMTNSEFKTLIKSKIESYALVKLNEMKQKHEKSQYLKSSAFKVSEFKNEFLKSES